MGGEGVYPRGISLVKTAGGIWETMYFEGGFNLTCLDTPPFDSVTMGHVTNLAMSLWPYSIGVKEGYKWVYNILSDQDPIQLDPHPFWWGFMGLNFKQCLRLFLNLLNDTSNQGNINYCVFNDSENKNHAFL